jgi:hypothetical protein
VKKGLVLVLLLLPLACARAAEEEPPYRVVRLTVRPAAASTPALRYHLLPELRETRPGNAAVLYYRSFAPEWVTYTRPKIAEKLGTLELKPGQKPPAEFDWVLTAKFLEEVERGARRSYCDWEMTERIREQGIATLLPDIQGMRQIARVLQLRARFEMFDGKPEQVHRTLQTGFMLGRHVSEGPTLIQSLVGNAITAIMLHEVEQWIGRPDGPNLYWPLTDLPRPYIDLRRPLQGEKLFLDQLLPGLRDSASGDKLEPLSLDQLRKMPTHSLAELEGGGVARTSAWEVSTGIALWTARMYPTARQSLIARGRKPSDVDRLPMLQVVLLDELATYDRLYDDMIKWYGLPYPEARRGLQKTEQDFKQLRFQTSQLNRAGILAGLLLPAITKVHLAGARIERHIDLLRCVEALRLHAAAHDGKLPDRLEDIKKVFVPPDPITGKPFEYTVKGNQATLYAPPPAGDQPNQGNAVKFEITLAK